LEPSALPEAFCNLLALSASSWNLWEHFGLLVFSAYDHNVLVSCWKDSGWMLE
jgi:hypothetical protein